MESQSSAFENPSTINPSIGWYHRQRRSDFDDSDELTASFKKLKLSDDAHPPSPDLKPQKDTIITLDFVKGKIEDFKKQNKLDKGFVHEIIKKTRDLLRPLPSLVDVNVPDGKHITVCGDLHGQFYDLLKLFEINGLPSENNPYVFNGDFVDRGSYSVEVILTLFLFKCMSPSAMHLTRGNHESKSMNKKYGFKDEVELKLDSDFVKYFYQAFRCLPLALVINNKILVVHGGLPTQAGVKLSDIKKIDRFCEPPRQGLMCELLWNDPQSYPPKGSRGRRDGQFFSTDVTKRFLQDNNLELVVRSHEFKDGYDLQHDGTVITVFSAPNYRGQNFNRGAFIRFVGPRMKPIFFKYTSTVRAYRAPKYRAPRYRVLRGHLAELFSKCRVLPVQPLGES